MRQWLMFTSEWPPWSPPRQPPHHQPAWEAAFPASRACAQNWFPGKVSPVRDGARIKGFLKETGNLPYLKMGLFPAHVGWKYEEG